MGLFARWGRFVCCLLAIGAAIRADDRAAPRSVTELLPATELGALVIRDTDELQRKGDELIDGVGVPMSWRLSTLVPLAVSWMGIQPESFDRHAPVGVILTNRTKPQNWNGLVAAVPIGDREAICRDMRLAGVPGKIEPVRIAAGDWDYWKVGALDAHHLYLSGGVDESPASAALESMLNDPRLSSVLSEAARERADRGDLLIHWGTAEHRRIDDPGRSRNWRRGELSLDEDEQPVAALFEGALEQLQHYLLTVTLEDGVAIHQRLVFDGAAESPADQWLRDLRGVTTDGTRAERQPTLKGLPAGRVLAAGAARTTGARQQLLLRTIARLLTSETGGWIHGSFWSWNGGGLSDLRQVVVLGALTEVLPLADEVRFAIYPNADGTFGVVVILDTEHPQQVVATIRDLSDVVRTGATVSGAPTATDAVATEAEIRKWIRQLAADDFAIRSRATTLLLLLGSRAHSLLNEAADSEDVEVSTRARRLLAKSDLSREAREQRLLQGHPLTSLHPRLTYDVGGERHGDTPVDVIRLDLTAKERTFEPQLQEMLGSDWNRVRVVPTPQAVLLSFGSVGPRLSEAIENVQQQRAGLAFDAALARLPQDPQRLIELHVPLSRLVPAAEHRAWSGGEPRDTSPSTSLTACGLSASQDELWFDVHSPLDEVRGLVVKRGWSW